MDPSQAIDDMITEAVENSLFRFSLSRTWSPYQPGPVYAATDHVQGLLQLKYSPPNGGQIPFLTATYLHWDPNSNYLNAFTDMGLAEGGVYFGYQSSSGPVSTQLVGLGGGHAFGDPENLLIWGHEEQFSGSYEIGLPSQEVLWVYKYVIDPAKFHPGQFVAAAHAGS